MARNIWDVSDILLQQRAGDIQGNMFANLGQQLGAGIQQYGHNKQMASMGVADFEAAAQANPEMLQRLEQDQNISKEAKAAYNKLKSGGVGFKDAAILSTYAKSYVSNKAQALQQQIAQMQFGNMQRQQAETEELNKRIEAINFVKKNPYIAAPEARKYAEQLAQNPYLARAAQLKEATGMTPQASDLLQYIGAGAKGNVEEKTTSTGARYVVNPSTGAFQFVPLTAEQQKDVEAAKAEGELEAKSVDSLLSSVSDAAEIGRSKLASIGRIRDLYSRGATSGFGQEVITEFKNILSRAGYDVGKLADQQQLEKELNTFALETSRELMRGAGSVSNYEQKLVQNATANKNLSPKAVMQILDVTASIAERNVRLDQLKQELEDKNMSKKQIAREIRRARNSIPIPGIESLASLASKQEAAPSGEIETYEVDF